MFGSRKESPIQELEMSDKELFALLEKKGFKKLTFKQRRGDFSYRNSSYLVYFNKKENRIEFNRSVGYTADGPAFKAFAAFYYSNGLMRGDDWGTILEFKNWLLGKTYDD